MTTPVDPRRRNLRPPWKPGQTGNPRKIGNGRRPITDAARRRMSRITMIESLMRAVIRGNARAVHLFLLIVEGPPRPESSIQVVETPLVAAVRELYRDYSEQSEPSPN